MHACRFAVLLMTEAQSFRESGPQYRRISGVGFIAAPAGVPSANSNGSSTIVLFMKSSMNIPEVVILRYAKDHLQGILGVFRL